MKLPYLSDPGVKRIILILDCSLVMAVGTVSEGETDGCVGVHVDLVGVPSAVGAGGGDVFRGGNHGCMCYCDWLDKGKENSDKNKGVCTVLWPLLLPSLPSP